MNFRQSNPNPLVRSWENTAGRSRKKQRLEISKIGFFLFLLSFSRLANFHSFSRLAVDHTLATLSPSIVSAPPLVSALFFLSWFRYAWIRAATVQGDVEGGWEGRGEVGKGGERVGGRGGRRHDGTSWNGEP